MSRPDDIDHLGGEVLRKSRTRNIRERMRSFLNEYGGADPVDVRPEEGSGSPLSEIVDEERNERI